MNAPPPLTLPPIQPDADELAALAQLQRLLEGFIGQKFWSHQTNLKLERITWLTDTLGKPQLAYPTVHVGGTSGKGTVASQIAAILSFHDQRIGLHLSPYVQALNETWQLDGRNAVPSRVLPVAQTILSTLGDDAPVPYGLPSYFEFKVALGFQLFRAWDVSGSVIEVGLGGSLDGTNVLGSGIKVLTNVGLDHTEILGDTVEKIAADKVGIFKTGSTVFSAVRQPSVQSILREECKRLGCTLAILGREFTSERISPSRLKVNLPMAQDLVLSIPTNWPPVQVENATLAMAAARAFLGHELTPDLATDALRSVALPGRVEEFEDHGVTIVLDGAHNLDKLLASAAQIQSRYCGKRRLAVVALKDGKESLAVLDFLVRFFDHLVFTTFNAPPWVPVEPSRLAQAAIRLGHRSVETQADPEAAYDLARGAADPGDLLTITGSFYLVGNLRHRWVSLEEAILRGGSYTTPT